VTIDPEELAQAVLRAAFVVLVLIVVALLVWLMTWPTPALAGATILDRRWRLPTCARRLRGPGESYSDVVLRLAEGVEQN